MKNIKKLVQDIHKGKDLRINLEVYRDMAVGAYHDYAAIELVFSAYLLMEELDEIRPEYEKKEEQIIQKIREAIRTVIDEDSDREAAMDSIRQMREEITGKMDLFTAYTDRMICYEYVLNRMEKKYTPAKELDKILAEYREDEFMQKLMLYMFASGDQAAITENIRTVIGQMPVRITKSKFYERLAETLTLYRDGDKSSLDSFLYMVKTSAMLYEPNDYQHKYPEFMQFIEKMDRCDYNDLAEEEYNQIVLELEEKAKDIHEITDFYYTMQRVVNGMYAVLICHKYDEGYSAVVRDSLEVLQAILDKKATDEMLVPFEGKIERYVEQTSYLESVLFEIRSSYQKELEELSYVTLLNDLVTVANLLSGSLFIDVEAESKEEIVDNSYVAKVTEELTDELDAKFATVTKPVKRAIMGMVLEKLPMIFKNSEEVEKYIRSNLFGCTDKVEKAAVLDILSNLMKEE